jgi:hypothetical protein
MRTNVRFIVALAAISIAASAHAQAPAGQKSTFRPPFDLNLHIDKKPDYHEHFDRTPYVSGNQVFVFPGERFGINVTLKDDKIAAITYEPEGAKSDIEFHLTQETITPQLTIMVLVTRNGLKRKLLFDARMTIPNEKAPFDTNITPVEPGQSSYESWPNPIIQLILSNFRLTDPTPPAKP